MTVQHSNVETKAKAQVNKIVPRCMSKLINQILHFSELSWHSFDARNVLLEALDTRELLNNIMELNSIPSIQPTHDILALQLRANSHTV